MRCGHILMHAATLLTKAKSNSEDPEIRTALKDDLSNYCIKSIREKVRGKRQVCLSKIFSPLACIVKLLTVFKNIGVSQGTDQNNCRSLTSIRFIQLLLIFCCFEKKTMRWLMVDFNLYDSPFISRTWEQIVIRSMSVATMVVFSNSSVIWLCMALGE